MASGIEWKSRMPFVTLDWYEAEVAAAVGVRRNLEAMRDARRPAFGMKADDAWRAHVEGACGEMAVAKLLGLYWSGSVNTFRVGGDVANLQVRTRSKDDYDLLVRHCDRDGDVFVLVTGACPSYCVRGWMLGKEAKQPGYFKELGGRPGAYFVPQWSLRDIRELLEVSRGILGNDVPARRDDQPA